VVLAVGAFRRGRLGARPCDRHPPPCARLQTACMHIPAIIAYLVVSSPVSDSPTALLLLLARSAPDRAHENVNAARAGTPPRRPGDAIADDELVSGTCRRRRKAPRPPQRTFRTAATGRPPRARRALGRRVRGGEGTSARERVAARAGSSAFTPKSPGWTTRATR
jgi:hypothetical protein